MFPKLARSHPNFFVIYVATAFFHLAMAVMNIVTPERFNAPSLDKVYWFAPRGVWIGGSLLVWLLMTLGVYWRFILGRFGLIIGMTMMLLRGVLIELSGNAPGVGLLAWGLIAVLHYSQLAEPQSNPKTARS